MENIKCSKIVVFHMSASEGS